MYKGRDVGFRVPEVQVQLRRMRRQGRLIRGFLSPSYRRWLGVRFIFTYYLVGSYLLTLQTVSICCHHQ